MGRASCHLSILIGALSRRFLEPGKDVLPGACFATPTEL